MIKDAEFTPFNESFSDTSPQNITQKISQVQHSFLICEEQQSLGLVDILVQSAKKNSRKFCVIDAANTQDFERLLTSVSFDNENQIFNSIPGPLWECLEDKNGGKLIILNPLAPTAEGLFNGIFDRIPLLDLSGQHTIKISHNLQIIGIHTSAQHGFKISQLSKSWRDRFHQHYWLPDSKKLPLPSQSFFESPAQFDEKLKTQVIDCQFYASDQLSSHWLHSYPLDEKGARSLKRGVLAELFTDSKSTFPQIKLKNLDINDACVKKFLQEIQHSPLQKLDGYNYDLSQCKFFFEPFNLKELQTQTAGKKLIKINADQLSRIPQQERIWWVNRQNAVELHELLYSDSIRGKDRHVWRNKPGFLAYFAGRNPVFVISQTLAPASWHRLLQDENIKSLYVLDDVFIPEPWTTLFTEAEIPVAESKTTAEETCRVQVYLCEPRQQTELILSLKLVKGPGSLVLSTSSDHGIELLQDYDAKRHYTPGPLWQALSESRNLIISGDTLLSKLPNLFSRHGVIASSNGEIKEFKSDITLIIEPKIWDQHPCLQVLPKITVQPASDFKDSLMPAGYRGIKQALLDGQRIIFAKGPKASGKSHSVSRLVEDKIAQVFTYTLSPSTKFTDIAAIVTEWSKPNPDEEKRLRVIVFDEMNLANPKILLWLQALLTTPETIILPGNQIISLTPAHRVLCLMNKAEETIGRQVHPVLEALACTVEFEPLNDDELKQMLATHHSLVSKSDDIVDFLHRDLLAIRDALKLLEPELMLTPRDFQAIIALNASWDYQPPQMHLYTETKIPRTLNPLLLSIFQVIAPQLSITKRNAFRHWLQTQSQLSFEEKPSPLCSMWVKNLLKENPGLWNTSSSRRLMATVLSYLQTHAFYQQQKKRLMPGKFGLLLLGETNTGKTFLSDFLLKIWGYQAGKNWHQWTAGAHGDLAALIQKNLMTSIHEANMISTEILEGAINAIVPNEDNAEFGLILTANAGYRYREVLSDPLLSRLYVINIDSPAPEEILSLSGLPQKDQEALLMTHHQAGQLASIRGLLNAIQLRKSGLELAAVCEMVYGLLLKEIEGTAPISTIETQSSFADFLTILGFNLVVCEKTGISPLGRLIRDEGVIEIPPLPTHANEDDRQTQFDLIAFRALDYQEGNEENAMKKLFSQHIGSYSKVRRLKNLMSLTPTTTLESPPPAKSEDSKLIDLFSSKSSSSGGQYLPQKSNTLALFDKNQPGCVSLMCYEIDEKTRLPVFEAGEFKLCELPRHFYPEFLPEDSEGNIEVTLQLPISTYDNQIPLISLPGYYPKLLDSEAKIIWRQGKFCASYPTDVSLPLETPFRYILVPEQTAEITSRADASPLPGLKFPLDESKLSQNVRQCLQNLRKAKEIIELKTALESLWKSLSLDFSYLNRNNHHARQALNSAYQKNDLTQVFSLCISTKKIVCIESALILYVLCQPVLAKFGIPVYLNNGIAVNNGIATSEGHSFVLVKWSHDTYPIIYDATPTGQADTKPEIIHSQISTQSQSSWKVPPNPLLIFHKDSIVNRLQSLFNKLYKFSLKNQRPVFQLNPPGVPHPIREYLGLPAFELSLFDQKWSPQALLITGFPYLESGKNLYEQYSCIHFLAEIFLEKRFELLVWTKAGAVSAKNADTFIDLLVNQLQTPAKEDLEKLKYAFPYQIMDESHWREFLIDFARILLTHLDTASDSKYNSAKELGAELNSKFSVLREKNYFKQRDEDDKNSLQNRFLSIIGINTPELKPEHIPILCESEEYKKLKLEAKDFATFVLESKGKIQCSALSKNFISNYNDPQLLISDSTLCQAYLDRILSFPQVLQSQRQWIISFNNCVFLEKLSLNKLPSCFRTIEFYDCKNYLPNFNSLPPRKYDIRIINSNFINYAKEIDDLINKTVSMFKLTVSEKLLPPCITVKRCSSITGIEIESSDSKKNQKIILERPVLLRTTMPLELTYLFNSKDLEGEQPNALILFKLQNFFNSLAHANVQKIEFVIDKASAAYQEKLLNNILQIQKEMSFSFPIQLYCANDAIDSFVQACQQPSSTKSP